MDDILQRIGSGSSISINSQELQSNTVIYQGLYDTKNWSGDILAYEMDDQGNVQTPAKWSAQDRVDLQHWDTGRQIITFDGTDGIPFRPADILATAPPQDTDIDPDAATASAMVNYLRGENSNEQPIGLGFRSRDGKLGDIVHATPLLLGDLLYVGSNDGMLHAFEKDTGDERFAYVPRLVYKKLSVLTTPNPGYSHKYFVDQAPYAARVGASDLLVGTLGKGGKGLYCLDVTNTANAESNAATMVKWEYPDSTDPDISPDPDLGYGFSRAFIVDSNLGSKVVILGNGYESANDKAVLYILDAATGVLRRKIDTGVGGPAPDCNGLSTPVLIDTNNDRKVDYVYAGDLLGNLWKFDLTDPDPANWEIAYSDGIDPQPLFQAKNEQGFRQPITMQPDVMRACDATAGGYMVTFGTGRYIGNADFIDTSVQTVYGIWDWEDAWEAAGHSGPDKYLGSFTGGTPRRLSNLDLNGGLSATARAATLLEQTQIYFGSALGEEFRVLSDNDIDWFNPDVNPALDTGSHVGWYFDLPATGERAVMDVFIRDRVLNSITTIPSNTPCGAGGKSFIMSMDACDGGVLGTPFFDLNGDGIIDMKDMINIGSPANPIWVVPSGIQKTGIYYTPAVLSLPGGLAKSYYSTSTGSVISTIHKDETKGLFSWREIE
jgi:Tfp pilus tip-associated adhesin PilY1